MGLLDSLFRKPPIAELRKGRNTVALITALEKRKEWTERRDAAIALGEIGGSVPLTFTALNTALRDQNPGVRDAAAEALVKLRAASLRDKSKEVRKASAEVLGKLGKEQAVEPLLAALQDEAEEVRAAAADALGNLRARAAVEPLIALLQNEKPGLTANWAQGKALLALGKIKDPRALEPVADFLNNPNEWMAMAAAFAVGELGDVRAAKPLTVVVDDKRWEEYSTHSGRCANIIGRAAYQTMLKLVTGTDDDPRIQAARLIKGINNAKRDKAQRVGSPAEGVSEADETSQAVEELLAIYAQNPQGFVKGEGGAAEQDIRRIGQGLDERGGMDLMRAVHAEFQRRVNILGAPRNLEHMWDGVGNWRG